MDGNCQGLREFNRRTFKSYFLKARCTSTSPGAAISDQLLTLQTATGNSARALAEGELFSTCTIDAVVFGLAPKAVGWGHYQKHKSRDVYFFLGNFYNMALIKEPSDPAHFMYLENFSVEKARFSVIWIPMFLTACSVLAFGWALHNYLVKSPSSLKVLKLTLDST
jgi:hypothetical protein